MAKWITVSTLRVSLLEWKSISNQASLENIFLCLFNMILIISFLTTDRDRDIIFQRSFLFEACKSFSSENVQSIGFMHRDDKDLVFAGLTVTYKTGIVWTGNDTNAVWTTNTVGASWDKEPFPHDASLLFDGDDDKVLNI